MCSRPRFFVSLPRLVFFCRFEVLWSSYPWWSNPMATKVTRISHYGLHDGYSLLPMSSRVEALKIRISRAIQQADEDMISRTGKELNYSTRIRHVTKGMHRAKGKELERELFYFGTCFIDLTLIELVKFEVVQKV